jgi:hypothetical protein
MRAVLLRTLLAAVVVLVMHRIATGAGQELDNPLGLDWPWERVSITLPTAEAAGVKSVRVGEAVRPVQVERVDDATSRLWFIATVRGESKSTRTAPNRQTYEFLPTAVESPLKVKREQGRITVDNGVAEFRFADSKADAPLQGVRIAGEADFAGQSAWQVEPRFRAAKTEITQQGGVFVDLHSRYELPDGGYYDFEARVVVGDPWVQIHEEYQFPSPTAYTVDLKPGLAPDTAMWIPWFGYEKFGGNIDLRFAPLQPLPMQRGPFVGLSPAWTQRPGGGQDFFATRGGEKGDPNLPAIGFVATHAAWWRQPSDQVISVNVANGDSAIVTFPVHRGARAYALVAGNRGRFDNTGKLNSLVRRHADWTLDDQMNRRVLTWKPDPAKAGPRVLMNREQLDRIRGDWQAGRDTPETRVIKDYAGKPLKGFDKDLHEFLTGKPIKPSRLPTAGLFLERRYQDDFLNPTGRVVRDMDDAFAQVDLFSDGKPWAGPWQAAVGYIFTDTNHWPGWLNEWRPANPNFHTDKYTIAAYAAAAMPDHPDATKWMDYAVKQFHEDIGRVLVGPDGVGAECPGYAGYSLAHQLKLARVFANAGVGNLVADNPLFKKTGQWHRHLLTPMDVRLKHRHTAPIGDTHKWTSGANNAFGMLATFYKDRDPSFASEMIATWRLLREQYLAGEFAIDLLDVDQSITSAPLEKLDWGSHSFEGFGTVMRSRFGSDRETFVSLKAGSTRGHYHNDDLSFHFYGTGTPLALDYNCSYTPRGDHAALHNSMTFGQAKPFRHIGEDREVPAMEQLTTNGRVVGFASTPAADAVVAERSGDQLVLSPVDPGDAKFQYPYPSRKVEPIMHRRTLVLVKHPAGSKLNDYLVIRDDTTGSEPGQINLHLLTRDLKQDSRLIRAQGQWDTDAIVYLAAEPKSVKTDRWFYFDEWMTGPGVYRKRGDKAGDDAAKAWAQQIRDTDGRALIPPKGWDKEWKVGEYQQWLKIEPAGASTTWVLYPRKSGDAEPTFATTEAGVTVSLGDERDTVELSATRATIDRGQKQTILEVPAIETK